MTYAKVTMLILMRFSAYLDMSSIIELILNEHKFTDLILCKGEFIVVIFLWIINIKN